MVACIFIVRTLMWLQKRFTSTTKFGFPKPVPPIKNGQELERKSKSESSQ
jgi:hypothetical protein